ncbi:hypothetical protein Cni_G22924 [Canna indica]|uniref:Uncharacterized protein n=1 Tax=Canna indica TaxID=4628 RepID=A0AAQ3QK10_9LILI|nr:hypothetical protein Cni_G22924 [Canna indica]
MRAVRGGGEGGGGEERREAKGSPRRAHEPLRQVQPDWEDAPGAFPGGGGEADPEEDGERRQSAVGEREERRRHRQELKLHSGDNKGGGQQVQITSDELNGVYILLLAQY